jgi:uncharacterized protein (TIGR03067 family)
LIGIEYDDLEQRFTKPASQIRLYEIKGNRWIPRSHQSKEWTFTLDETTSPKQISFTLGDGSQVLGIYELKGDEFRYCFRPRDRQQRPTSFGTKMVDPLEVRAITQVWMRGPAAEQLSAETYVETRQTLIQQRSQRLAAAEQLEARSREFLSGRGTLDILIEAHQAWTDAREQEYTTLLKHNRALFGMFMHKSRTAFKEGRYGDAESFVRKARELDPDHPVVHAMSYMARLADQNSQSEEHRRETEQREKQALPASIERMGKELEKLRATVERLEKKLAEKP